jgi:hypothetical protein
MMTKQPPSEQVRRYQKGGRPPYLVPWPALLLSSHEFAFDAAAARISVGRNGYLRANHE